MLVCICQVISWQQFAMFLVIQFTIVYQKFKGTVNRAKKQNKEFANRTLINVAMAITDDKRLYFDRNEADMLPLSRHVR